VKVAPSTDRFYDQVDVFIYPETGITSLLVAIIAAVDGLVVSAATYRYDIEEWRGFKSYRG